MSREERKTKRWKIWRPRFSLRTLVVVVPLLICAYFGFWEVTKRCALPQVVQPRILSIEGEQLSSSTDVSEVEREGSELHSKGVSFAMNEGGKSPAPFLIVQDEALFEPGYELNSLNVRRRYFLWFFGYKINLHVTKWKGR